MPRTDASGDITVVLNRNTNRYDFDFDATRDVKFDDTERHRVLSLLVEHRGKWWADTTGERGSQIHTLKNVRSTTPSQMEAFAMEALQKAVDEGKIQNVTASARRVSPTRIDLTVSYETAGGKPVTVKRTITA